MEGPFWGLLTQWGPDAIAFTLVASAVWMVFTGRLVTRREHDALRQDRDYWRDAHTTSEGTRGIMARQVETLLDGQELEIEVLRSLKEAVIPE